MIRLFFWIGPQKYRAFRCYTVLVYRLLLLYIWEYFFQHWKILRKGAGPQYSSISIEVNKYHELNTHTERVKSSITMRHAALLCTHVTYLTAGYIDMKVHNKYVKLHERAPVESKRNSPRSERRADALRVPMFRADWRGADWRRLGGHGAVKMITKIITMDDKEAGRLLSEHADELWTNRRLPACWWHTPL